MDDADLLAAYVDRQDQQAFADLVKRHAPMVVGICRRVAGESAQADDAAQAVFIALAARAAQLRGHPSLGGWLHRVATHVALRQRESERARRRREIAVPRVSEADDDRREELDEALARLPERYRTPIVLHHLQGEPAGAVATRLGLRPSALSMRLARGRELLRRALSASTPAVIAALTVHGTAQAGDAAAAQALAAQAHSLIAQGTALAAGSVAAGAPAALAHDALRSLATKPVTVAASIVAALLATIVVASAVAAFATGRAHALAPLAVASAATAPTPAPSAAAPSSARPEPRNDPMPSQSLRFLRREYRTTDIAAARRFYEPLFGWTVEAQPLAQGGSYQAIRSGGEIIGAFAALPSGSPPGWLSSLVVDDLDAAYRAVLAAGATSVSAPADGGAFGRSAIVADPAGAVFALRAAAPGDPVAGAPVPVGSWVWNELITTDAADALAFYGRAFGFTHSEAQEPTGPYRFLELGGQKRAGVFEMTDRKVRPLWVPYVHVDDVDASFERALGLGAQSCMPPTDIPGAGRVAMLADPAGAMLYVMKPVMP